jgi:hypothetical protein
MACRERYEVQASSTGVEIEHDVRHRQQRALEIVGDLFGERAVRAAGKDAVHVETVDRRETAPDLECGIVHVGNNDHASAHCLGRQPVREIDERDRSFVFIAMIPAGEERSRSAAVLDDSDGDHEIAPGRFVPAPRQTEESVLDPVGLEVDGGDDRIFLHSFGRDGLVSLRWPA